MNRKAARALKMLRAAEQFEYALMREASARSAWNGGSDVEAIEPVEREGEAEDAGHAR